MCMPVWFGIGGENDAFFEDVELPSCDGFRAVAKGVKA